MQNVFQTQAFIETTFVNTGFQLVHHELIRSEVSGSWAAYAEKLAVRADSILTQLSDREFDEGLAGLRQQAATARADEPVTELIYFFVFRSI